MNPLKEITTQTVAVGATSAATASPFGTLTTVIRVVSTTNCHIKIGADPTADDEDMFLPANVVEYFAVAPSLELAAIRSEADGVLYVTEMTR